MHTRFCFIIAWWNDTDCVNLIRMYFLVQLMDQSVLSKLCHHLPPLLSKAHYCSEAAGGGGGEQGVGEEADIIKTHREQVAVYATSLLLAACSWFGTYSSEVADANDFWLWLRRNWRGGGSSHGRVWLESDGRLIYFSHLPLCFLSFISLSSPSTRLENPPGITTALLMTCAKPGTLPWEAAPMDADYPEAGGASN